MSIPRWIRRREPNLVPIGQRFPRLLNCWPPKTPPSVPLLSRGAIYLAYIHSHMNLLRCAKFGANRPSRLVAFPQICAKVSSAFRRCTRWLAQKHAKKTTLMILYIENYNSGPNMQTSTSLTLCTAIFVVFSGALAEELMIFCRHVRTELYRFCRAPPGYQCNN